MSDFIQGIVTMIRAELEKPSWKKDVLQPLTQWLCRAFWPYVAGLILLNFFFTIAAVSLVLYLYRK